MEEVVVVGCKRWEFGVFFSSFFFFILLLLLFFSQFFSNLFSRPQKRPRTPTLAKAVSKCSWRSGKSPHTFQSLLSSILTDLEAHLYFLQIFVSHKKKDILSYPLFEGIVKFALLSRIECAFQFVAIIAPSQVVLSPPNSWYESLMT